MDAGALVRGLYEAFQERDWDVASQLLRADAVVDLPATGERLSGRDEIMAFQAEYPEPWGTLSVLRAVADGDVAVAEVGVEAPGGERFALAAFWTARGGLLEHGVEYWVDLGIDPPANRRWWRSGDQR